MLPPFIIEQIRKREEQERQRYEQPQLEIPAVTPSPPVTKRREEADDAKRGVTIIELL
jgi:hypothetical protein